MKPFQSKPLQKEIYRLWYEYLRESSQFMEACKIALAFEKKIGKKRYAQFWGPGIPGGRSWPGVEMLYGIQTFGNIHALNFDDWWEWKRKQLAEFEARKNILIEDYAVSAGQYISQIIYKFKKMTGRAPALDEFLSFYRQHLQSFDDPCLYLKINLRNAQNVEFLKKEIGKLVNQRKKHFIIKRNLQFDDRWIYPIGRIYQIEDLERYLRILRKFNGDMKWWQIAESEEIYRDRGHEDPRAEFNSKYRGKKSYDNPSGESSVKSSIYKDKRNAKEIIKNAQKGIFPGPYSRNGMKMK